MNVKVSHIIDVTVNLVHDSQWHWDNATRGEGFAWNVSYLNAVRVAQEFFEFADMDVTQQHEYLVTGRRS